MASAATTRSPRGDQEGVWMTAPSAEETFRRLAIGDPRLLARVSEIVYGDADEHRLDGRTEALLRIGALVALDAPESSYRTAVDDARRAGAGLDDLLAVLLAVAGPVGSARVLSAAPRLALAAGYDVEADLERNEPPGRRAGWTTGSTSA
jgi:4-carboxymuconolactone decarboxylase